MSVKIASEMPARFIRIEPKTSAFAAAWELRKAVLLDPFGIEHARAQGDDERATHFGLFQGEECLGCLMLLPMEERSVRMRQVAVQENAQRKGHGRILVLAAEGWAKDQGAELMIASAREVAIPFYMALGYRATGEPFEQVGLPHRAVQKRLI